MSDNHLLQDTAEASARLYKIEADVEDATIKIIRMWPNLDATLVDSLLTTLKGVSSVTNPKIDGQTYSGTFNIGRVYADADNDRSVTIYQELVPNDPFEYEVTVAIDYLSDETYRIFQDITETQLTAKLAEYTRALYTRGNSYRFDFNRNSETKLWNLRIVKTTVYEREETEFTSKAAFNVTEKTQEIRNLEGTQVPDATAYDETTHTMHSVSGRVTNEGRYDVIKTSVTKDVTPTAITFESEKDTLKSTENVINLNVPADNALLNITAPATGEAKAKRIRNYDPEFNVADVEDVTTTGEARTTLFTAESAYDRSKTIEIKRNASVDATTGLQDATARQATASSVTLTTIRGERNEFKNMADITVETDVRNKMDSVVTGETFEDASRTEVTTISLNKPAATNIVTLSPVAGETMSARLDVDAVAGTVNIQQETSTAKEQTLVQTIATTTLDKTISVNAVKGTASVPVPTAVTSPGTTITVNADIRSDGKVNAATTTVNQLEASEAFANIKTEASGEVIELTTVKRGVRPSDVSLTPAEEDGVDKSVSLSGFDPDLGTATVVSKAKTSRDLTSYDTTDTHDRFTVSTKKAISAPLTTVPVAGDVIASVYQRTGTGDSNLISGNVVKHISQKPTRFYNRYEEVITYDYGKLVDGKQDFPFTTGYKTKSGSTIRVATIRNADDSQLQTDIVTYGNGTYNVSFGVPRKNSFGLWDYTITYQINSDVDDSVLTAGYYWTKVERQYRTKKSELGVKQRQYRLITMYWHSRIFASSQDAQTFLDQSHSGSRISGDGSGIRADRLYAITYSKWRDNAGAVDVEAAEPTWKAANASSYTTENTTPPPA